MGRLILGLGLSLWLALPSLALPSEQVINKLRSVVVFTLVNAQGAPIIANAQSKTPSMGVFLTPKGAQAFLEGLKTNKPDIAKELRVLPVSLAQVYENKLKSQARGENLSLTFIPAAPEVESAEVILGKKPFVGTPLFIARIGPQKVYMTINQSGQQIIPMFFGKAELQSLIALFKKQQPKETVEIQVISLEGVINTLETKNDKDLERIGLISLRESLEFVEKQQKKGS